MVLNLNKMIKETEDNILKTENEAADAKANARAERKVARAAKKAERKAAKAEKKAAKAAKREAREQAKKPPRFYDGRKHETHYLILMAVVSVLLYLYIETFARATSDILGGVKFMLESPAVFFYNCLIIFASFTIALLFKRRRFVFFFIGLIWFALGTVNGCILIKRMTPFTLYDLQNLEDGLSILTTYFSTFQIILIALAFIAILVMIVLVFIKSPHWQRVDYRRSALTAIVSVGSAVALTTILIGNGTLSTFFGNLNYAYRDYGVPYCFINTSLNTGISRPDDYSEDTIEAILNKTSSGTDRVLEDKDDSTDYPNVIVLQMESFTLASDYNHITVDTDPTPVFTSLMENYTSGWFEVPACGAGTANTEFEVLTGISAKFFGPGEYPYKGKLRKNTLESLAYVLRSHGYTTSAMHDHRALFYNRNEVYANLGFDSYTSIEYMSDITKTPKGWAKDEVMTDDIIEIMEESEGRDFLHIISVEGHGSYPEEQVFKNPYVTVTADDEVTKWKYEYYLNEVHEMDTFIGGLIERIEETGEPTIMLIYGDHIPALDVTEDEYGTGDLYQTRYVIWDNIGLEKNDRDIHSYDAAAVMLEDIGLTGEGTIFDYQQSNDSSDADYLDDLKALAYDMLYGDNFVFGGKSPYKRINMTMGHKEIKINDIVKIGEHYFIRGENFTEHSSISLDGKLLDTVYLSSSLLALNDEVDPADAPLLEVSQIDTKDNTILSTIGYLEEL